MAFLLFCSKYHPKVKVDHHGLSIGDGAKKRGEMWNHTAARDKVPNGTKAELKEKYGKEVAGYWVKGEPHMEKKKGRSVSKTDKSKKKKEEEEDEEVEEKDEDKEDKNEDDDDSRTVCFLRYKVFNPPIHNPLLLKKYWM